MVKYMYITVMFILCEFSFDECITGALVEILESSVSGL